MTATSVQQIHLTVSTLLLMLSGRKLLRHKFKSRQVAVAVDAQFREITSFFFSFTTSTAAADATPRNNAASLGNANGLFTLLQTIIQVPAKVRGNVFSSGG